MGGLAADGLAARLAIVAGAVLFSTGGIAIKLCGLDAWQIAAFRPAVAAVAIAVCVPAARRALGPATWLVAVPYAATIILFTLANRTTTAAHAIFLQDTAPLWVLLLGPVLLGERLERREGWFRVRLTTGSAWINASDRNEFYSLERLLKDGLTHLTTDWNRRLSSEPGGVERTMKAVADQEEPSVRVTRFATVAGNQWMFVEVLSHSGCERVEEPSVVDRGWIPAHAATGKPTAWFSSRGC